MRSILPIKIVNRGVVHLNDVPLTDWDARAEIVSRLDNLADGLQLAAAYESRRESPAEYLFVALFIITDLEDLLARDEVQYHGKPADREALRRIRRDLVIAIGYGLEGDAVQFLRGLTTILGDGSGEDARLLPRLRDRFVRPGLRVGWEG